MQFLVYVTASELFQVYLFIKVADLNGQDAADQQTDRCHLADRHQSCSCTLCSTGEPAKHIQFFYQLLFLFRIRSRLF